MKIAMVGPFGLHPKQTMRSRALPLAKQLVARGHTVQIFMPPWHTPEKANTRWQEDGVTLRYVPLSGGILGITRHLLRESTAWQPDLLHLFKPKAYSGLALWWLWQFQRHKRPLWLDTDDWEGWGGWNDREPYTAVQKHFFAWQESWGLTHCHGLTVASQALQTIALSRGVPQQRLLYLPNGPGIRPSAPRPSAPHPPTLLIYSRFFEFDVARLVDVLARVHTTVADLKIQLVGASLFDQDMQQFRQLASQANLLPAIEEHGWVPLADLPALLAQADVGIYLMDDTLLNRTKCPVKLADLLAVGLPVVAEAVGQVPQYVLHGRTGLLRPSGDSAGIAQDLIELLQNPAERQRLSTAAQQHVQTAFSWHALAQTLETAYQSQLNS